jgi:NAD(P)-dependent dehydrogenase (short-subunit alcohol dehydrogenase family)
MSTSGVAVVTGGARGIGRAIAASLAAEGYHVVILDNGTELDGTAPMAWPAAAAAREIIAAGGSAEAAACDAGDAGAVSQAIAGAVSRHGPVGVLANVAGILRPGPFLRDTDQTWAAVLSAHLGGHLAAIAAVLPGMASRGHGHIINVTSTAALLGSRRQPAYSTAKQAIVGLTRALAPLLQPAGIAVNAISPAAESRMSAGAPPAPDPVRDQLSAELSDRGPGHVGEFARWLTGPAAAGISGRVFLVSGHYVVEYEHLRPLKWSAVPPGASRELVAERVRWVLGRPHPAVIGPWPTRDFGLTEMDRLWEGTGASSDLREAALADRQAAAGTIPPGAPPAGTVVTVPACSHGPAAPPGIPQAAETCAAVAQLIGRVQSALALASRDGSHSVVVLLPPWPGEKASGQASDLACTLLWYAAIGLIRGSAATEAVYGVRVNGLVAEPGQERLADAVTGYLLGGDSGWLNGYVLTADSLGVGVLSDERPRWQGYFTGPGFPLPPAVRRELGQQLP